MAERFDADYYRRYYRDPATRVSDRATIARLAGFVAGYLRHLGIPVRSLLDVGCGLGHWQAAAARLWPRARYFGVETSRYLCERHGWTHGSVVDFDATRLVPRGTFDLVVCQGVLQYLDDREAPRALANLARWCRGALYLEALTRTDWTERCDRRRTDGTVHLRSGVWYRRRLGKQFLAGGGGVFVSRAAGVTMFELEGN
jgi:SAM-dependent methyltransferase